MRFAERHAITDACVLVQDVETSVAFYRDRLGFALTHRAEGFADFEGPGVTLALWERAHLHRHTGAAPGAGDASGMAIAVRLDSAAALDAAYAELLARGVRFVRPPADYPWNARCAYFAGPDGETWELYAWLPGGAPGTLGTGPRPGGDAP